MKAHIAAALVRSLVKRIRAALGELQPHTASIASSDDLLALDVISAIAESASEVSAKGSPGSEKGQDVASPLAQELAAILESPAPSAREEMDTSCLAAPIDPATTLCLDFGTARSKAFATRGDAEDYELGDLRWIDLPIGRTALGESESAMPYSIESALWISDGRCYLGDRAIELARTSSAGGEPKHRPLLSLKSYLAPGVGTEVRLESPIPTDNGMGSVALTLRDALFLYLAYLTDMALVTLRQKLPELKGLPLRRFALPCWPESHRRKLMPAMADLMAVAQLGADSLHGQWDSGIPLGRGIAVARAALGRAEECSRFLSRDLGSPEGTASQWGAVLEPLAAGWGRAGASRVAMNLMLVVDVGAGTTDVSLFATRKIKRDDTHVTRAWPADPYGVALPVAGDELDRALIAFATSRLQMPEGSSDAVSAFLMPRIRRIKETLFATGRSTLVVPQVQGLGSTVTLALDEFKRSEGYLQFESRFRQGVSEYLNRIDDSWIRAAQNVVLITTGGGRDLPVVQELARGLDIRGLTIRPVSSPRIPEDIRLRFGDEFEREYPQLAVVVGGAVPGGIEERSAQARFAGSFVPPGPVRQVPPRWV